MLGVFALGLTQSGVVMQETAKASVSLESFAGQAPIGALPDSVVLGGGYKKSDEAIAKAKEVLDTFTMFFGASETEKTEMNDFFTLINKVKEAQFLLAVNDMSLVDFDTFDTDEANLCLVARVKGTDEVMKAVTEDAQADKMMVEELYGFVYVTSEGCMKNRSFADQGARQQTLNSMAAPDMQAYFYVNKGLLQKHFMMSQTYKDVVTTINEFEKGSTEGMEDQEAKEHARVMAMMKNVFMNMQITKILMEADRFFVGVRYQNGVLASEFDARIATPALGELLNETFDGGVRMNKLYMTDKVTTKVLTGYTSGVSYNRVELGNIDASVLVGKFMPMFLLFGTMGFSEGMMMDESYEEAMPVYEEEAAMEEEEMTLPEMTEEELNKMNAEYIKMKRKEERMKQHKKQTAPVETEDTTENFFEIQ